MTLPPLPELKPCPFCEGEKHFKSSNGVESNYVVCAGCGAEGPAAETTAAAHAAWNRRAALAQPPAPTAQPAPVNGIKATMFHDEGAIAQCSSCGRYTLDPKALGRKTHICDCGEEYGWSGSFSRPGPDAKWSGKAPTVQPVQQPGAEPDMRHPKIQALIGSKARCQIELMLVEQLIEDPDCDLTSMDMEYWGPMHDRLKEALTKAAPAQRQPLSDEEIEAIWKAHVLPGFGERQRFYSPVVYARAIESAHGIAAQKGEKL